MLNSEGVGSDWSVAAGIHYAIDHGVEVINLSLSSTQQSEIIEEAIERAADLGIVTVSAAGNFDTDTPQYPAVESPALGVAAVDEQDVKASFSSYHDDLTIAAPGISGRCFSVSMTSSVDTHPYCRAYVISSNTMRSSSPESSASLQFSHCCAARAPDCSRSFDSQVNPSPRAKIGIPIFSAARCSP